MNHFPPTIPPPILDAVWAWRREYDRMLQPREKWPLELRRAVEHLESLRKPVRILRDDEEQFTHLTT